MTALKAIFRAILALFIDDGSLVLGALAWLAICALLFHAAAWGGPAFFIGLALLLGENTLRAARHRRA